MIYQMKLKILFIIEVFVLDMAEKRIRKASFSGKVEYLKCIGDELFIVSGGMMHILNMYGVIVEDVKLPPGTLMDVFRSGDLIFVRMKRSGCYYFKLGDVSVSRIGLDARVMKAYENVLFLDGNSMFVLEVPSLINKLLMTMPSEVVDFVEVASKIYVLFKTHLCFIQKPLYHEDRVLLEHVECLSHLTFTCIKSNGNDFLVLEAPEELVVYGMDASFWLLRKSSGYHGYEVSDQFLIMLSDSIEMYRLDDGVRFAKLCVRTSVLSHDACRRRLWIYSKSLYEVDVTKPFE